ncbi:hypothetical protein F5Y07DRAFT_401288 [Xylaria sp. FL0933]|nr:hypothetical protein F5Y07DRAFT_401288 [Xylaria sp. FL0933]
MSHGNLISGPGPYVSQYGRSLYAQPADLTLRRQCISQHVKKERAEWINGPLKRTEGDFTYDLSLKFRGIPTRLTQGPEEYAWTDLNLVETSEHEENSRSHPEQSSLVLATFYAPPPLQSSLLNSSCFPAPRFHLAPRPLPSWMEDGHDITAPSISQPFEPIRGVKRNRTYGDHGGYYRDDEEGEESDIENQRPTKFRKLSAEDTEEEFSESSAPESDREYDGTMAFWYKKEKRQKHRGERKAIKRETKRQSWERIAARKRPLPQPIAARKGCEVHFIMPGSRISPTIASPISSSSTSMSPTPPAAREPPAGAHDPALPRPIHPWPRLPLQIDQGYDYEQSILPPLRAPGARSRPPLSPMEPRYNYPALPADFVLPGDPLDGYLSLASPPSPSQLLTPSEREAAKYYLEVTTAQALRASI